ncbi:hypothetical protein SODG_005912 [Sodalis praecaptivus]
MFTDRERCIIFLSLQRLSSKRIGQRLQISHRTVENRFQVIYHKLGIHNVWQLDDYCRQEGLMHAIPRNGDPASVISLTHSARYVVAAGGRVFAGQETCWYDTHKHHQAREQN